MEPDARATRREEALDQGPGLRTGFTTGACAAAAARAATRAALLGEPVDEIAITLPNGDLARFAVTRCEPSAGGGYRCAVVKDAGDDPDCTHGAEIVADVELRTAPGVEIRAGVGVATVTRRGLGLAVGAPAINPVPRRNITEMVAAELADGKLGAVVTISVPRGEEIARATLNARLGLLGGISILGTTGIVRPFSTAAWRASVAQAIDVARAEGLERLVLTTGGRSERFAMALLPGLPEAAFVQVGDDVGLGVRHAARRGAKQVTVVAMVGKLAKMAAGASQTHVSTSRVDCVFLAELAGRCGASARVVEAIAQANTARHALERADSAGVTGLPRRLCQSAAETLAREAGPALDLRAALVDFDGALRAAYPSLPEAR